MKTSADIRNAFLEFFKERNHQEVASSSLVPANDPTLLFVNAGMVQFKDVFLGRDKRNYQRATTSQRCVRAGGKHNDLENVGYTARHHTFFEMLGNFSFGDYFKEDAIQYAWEFLTEVMQLPKEKLWVTVYDDDLEAEKIWFDKIGINKNQFSRCGAKDNFWSMGDTGPCGPCSEIFYDHGDHIWGGPPGSKDEEGDRYIEIWNLVFMQFNRDASGNMTPLPRPSVDTGMGLERLVAIKQQVHNNYDIDIFKHLVKKAGELANCTNLEEKSLRVIADHIRSCAFLIVDGILPSNEGRGYVLRRIIRRAVRHGYMLGIKEIFFYKLVATLNDQMGDAYPELSSAQSQVERVLILEERRFAETLEQGMKILEQTISDLTSKEIDGETVFKLYDTFGFPTDLTADIAREGGLSIDMAGFETAMEAQRSRARAANQFSIDQDINMELDGETDFTGYEKLTDRSTVLALIDQGEMVDHLSTGDNGIVILDHTPFYAESGGQAGDKGQLQFENGLFEVTDTQKNNGAVFLHIGKLTEGHLHLGDTIEANVHQPKRSKTALNHSATHLLHAALQQVMGDQVQQRGSLVDEYKLRFDFTCDEPIKRKNLIVVEQLVNQQIRENHMVQTRIMSLEDAKKTGAMALFGEKYSEQVRVLRMGKFSTELCGGTHVKALGDIGLFKITAESGIASGVRRIEALTGAAALTSAEEDQDSLQAIATLTRSSRTDIIEKVSQLLEKNKGLEKELDRLKTKAASSAGSDLASQALDISGVKVLAAKLSHVDPKSLRDTLDQLKNKLGSAVILLATEKEGKVSLIAGVTKDLTSSMRAGDLVKLAAVEVGGKGGGRPDMAQAGGNNPDGMDQAIALVADWVKDKMESAQ